ncbi:hypothetical protein JXD38_07975 [candidate division WOR-3 bacterium]|nr:hypothetical protein [candidate division WOR-3 bacterium]
MQEVTVAVTRTCPHRQVLTRYFHEHSVPCEVKFIEEDEKFRDEHKLTRSPNVLIGERVVCRGMPSPVEFERIRRMCDLPRKRNRRGP